MSDNNPNDNGAGEGSTAIGAAALAAAAAAAPAVDAKASSREATGPAKAAERLYYRNQASRNPEIKIGRFFARGDALTGVDAAHIKDMDKAGQVTYD